MQSQVHRTAEVSPRAIVGTGTQVWNEAQIREGAEIGCDCILGKGVYIDVDVVVGDRVKLENRVSLFRGTRLGSGVFVGPHTCLLNDKRPRALTPAGDLKNDSDWIASGVTVLDGASLGGAVTVLPGVKIGRYAMIGAGAVVTRDVPDHGLVVGNPASLVAYICECGGRLDDGGLCTVCGSCHASLARSAARGRS